VHFVARVSLWRAVTPVIIMFPFGHRVSGEEVSCGKLNTCNCVKSTSMKLASWMHLEGAVFRDIACRHIRHVSLERGTHQLCSGFLQRWQAAGEFVEKLV